MTNIDFFIKLCITNYRICIDWADITFFYIVRQHSRVCHLTDLLYDRRSLLQNIMNENINEQNI